MSNAPIFGLSIYRLSLELFNKAGLSNLVNKRNELVEFLQNKNILTGVHYPTPVHKMPAYSNRSPIDNLIQTNKLADRVISLQIYPELTVAEQDVVISTIREFFS